MRVFLFEYTTGGGLLADVSPATTRSDLAELATEGAAMITALARDFVALVGTHVSILRDARCPLPSLAGVDVHTVADCAALWAAFDEQARCANYTVLIAPECGGHLLACAERVLARGGRLLSPPPPLVRLASDKHATSEHLARAGIAVPQGAVLADVIQRATALTDCSPDKSALANAINRLIGGNPDLSLVLKPRDGAGSQGVRGLGKAFSIDDLPHNPEMWRMERFCPGTAASIAALCGEAGPIILPPCGQSLGNPCITTSFQSSGATAVLPSSASADGQFIYCGGWLPLPAEYAERAQRLARAAIATLPDPRGYIGLDLVLGADSAGRDDVVIEINPRLTTSYIGLRAATHDNLAAAMLAAAEGRQPALSFDQQRIEFASNGIVTIS